MKTTEETATQPPAEKPPVWTCSMEPYQTKEGGLNVGDVLKMNCQGDFVAQPPGSTARFEFKDEKFSYTLHVLEVKNIDNTSALLDVTGYKAGKFTDVAITLTDGKAKVELAPQSWQTESILPPGQQVQPIGPFGPFQLSWPWWYWGSFIAIFLVVLIFIGQKLFRRYQRMRLLEELAEHGTALSPYNQFSKDMRKIIRRYQSVAFKRGELSSQDYLDDVDEAFRMFLVRKLLVPANKWSSKRVLREIRKRHRRLYQDNGTQITRLLQELDNAKKVKQQVTAVDCEQLAAMSRQVAETIYQTKKV